MFFCMQTPVHTKDHLFLELKKATADTGTTLTATIQDARREPLHKGHVTDRPKVELPLFRGTGVMPGLDLCDSAALLDLMKGENDPS